MRKYVMFGHSPLFGDYLDIIRAQGGILKKVVQNIPEPDTSRFKPLRQQIEEYYNSFPDPAAVPRIQIQQLEEFRPEPDETYIIGFRSQKLIPLRKQLIAEFGLEFSPLVHPTAFVSPTVKLPEGIIIGAGCLVGAGVRLGRYMLINRGASVGHDGIFDDFVNVGPGARLASHLKVGRSAIIGIGATVIEQLKIGKHSMVAAGAVVINDVPEHTLVAGVPAQAKKRINLDIDSDKLDA